MGGNLRESVKPTARRMVSRVVVPLLREVRREPRVRTFVRQPVPEAR
jgi:hypothetical protein